MKKSILLCCTGIFFLSPVVNGFTADIVWEDISKGNLNLTTLSVNRENPLVIYAGSGNAVLKTEDGGTSWKNVLSVKGQNKKVNQLLFNPKNNNSIYAATGNGLFYSSDQGKTWRKIFKGKNYLENDCASIIVYSESIYLGTKKGLFISKNKGNVWYKSKGKLANSRITAIALNINEPDYLYAACAEGVFLSKDHGETWKKIFSINFSPNHDNDNEEINEEEKETINLFEIRHLITDNDNPDNIYLATSDGIYRSIDKGLNWNTLTDYGLLDKDVRFLLITPNSQLYAASGSDVSWYGKERWHELSVNITAKDIRALDFDNRGNLYAVSDNGLFKTNRKLNNDIYIDDNLTELYDKNEPEISDVQKAAIKYAEVEPEKILRWRNQAQKKALLPKFSTSINRNTTDLRHWETGSTTKSGDDLLHRGKDTIEWDVTLTWDLGEIIWTNDQTSIDARSRLMVELRDNILDEVTKLYFERLRVKMELNNLSIQDKKKRFDKRLRLQELTALLDALTGGYFSQQVQN